MRKGDGDELPVTSFEFPVSGKGDGGDELRAASFELRAGEKETGETRDGNES